MAGIFRLRWLLAWGMCCAFGTPAVSQTYWEMSPYKIQLLLAIDPELEAGTPLLNELPAEITQRTDNFIGAAWQLSVEVAQGAARNRLLTALPELSADDLGELPKDVDKQMVMTIAPSPVGMRVNAREFDVRTQIWGPIVTRDVAQRAMLPAAAFEALWQAFAPVAQIDMDADRNIMLRPRAIGLPLRDKSLQMVREGDLFRPVIRKIDRQGKTTASGIQTIPWTFIAIEKLTGMSATCKLHSGLRQSLGRRRGQSEQLAIAVRPTHGSTMLTVVGRGKPPKPLAGYDVYAQVPGQKETTLVGRTNTNGKVEIPATDAPVRVLYLKGGGALLARLPMVPGLEPALTAEVADDDVRLALEGYLAALRDNVIDVVARREILMARIRNRINSGKFDEAEKFYDELRRLPTQQQLSLAITEETSRNKTDDAAVQARIDRMVADTQTFLRRFLDTRPIDALRTEMNEATRNPKTPPAAATPPATPSAEPAPGSSAPAADAGTLQPPAGNAVPATPPTESPPAP